MSETSPEYNTDKTDFAPWPMRFREGHQALLLAGWEMCEGGLYYKAPGDRPMFYAPQGALALEARKNIWLI